MTWPRQSLVFSIALLILIVIFLFYQIFWRQSTAVPRVAFADVQRLAETQKQASLSKGKERFLYEIRDFWEAEALHNALMDHTEMKCNDIQGKGSGDGEWKVCMDPAYEPKSPCLVYSFGIANDFSFDDALAAMGCDVHAFDPSMKQGDHKHAAHVWFHNLGVGVNNTDTFSPRKDVYVKDEQKWKIRNVATIMKELGHQGKTIDILKMDVEGYEFYVIKNMLETGVLDHVRQFLVEYHVFDDNRYKFVELFKITRELYDAGFRRFFSFRLNCPCPYEYCNQANIGFINTKFGKK